MAIKIDVELTESQKSMMYSIPEISWFTQVIYKNATSPIAPERRFTKNDEFKHSMVKEWISNSVKGKRVLDLFSANGAFAVLSALAGAKEVVGVEFSEERLKCAEFIASTLPTNCEIKFKHGDVYKITEYFDQPFDVVLCLGGLYHIADPALVLRLIRQLTKERLLLQTAQVLSYPGNWAKFIVRREDKTKKGETSVQGGYGTWHYSPECLRELLLHGGFKILEEYVPPLIQRRRYPWYFSLCAPI